MKLGTLAHKRALQSDQRSAVNVGVLAMKLHLHMACDNDVFSDGNCGAEIARIFHKLAKELDQWPGANEFTRGIYDLNGNKVGSLIAEED